MYASSDKYQVVLYEVQAPLMIRFKRYQSKFPSTKASLSLEEFVRLDDIVSFGRASHRSLKIVDTFVNSEESVDAFYLALSSK